MKAVSSLTYASTDSWRSLSLVEGTGAEKTGPAVARAKSTIVKSMVDGQVRRRRYDGRHRPGERAKRLGRRLVV